ncbi:MAG: ATP-binding protein [Candidatus Zixiibacteriota bacterium]
MTEQEQVHLEYQNKLFEIKAIQSELDGLVHDYKIKFRFLTSLLDSTPDFIFLINWRMKINSVNPAFVKFVGYPEDYLTGKTYYDIFPSDIADSFMLSDRKVLETGEAIESEDLLPGVHNEMIVHTIRTPVFENGNVKGILVSMRDITKLRKIEKDLIEKKQIIENISVLDPNYVKLCNRENGNIIYQNRPLLLALGYEIEENDLSDLIPYIHNQDRFKFNSLEKGLSFFDDNDSSLEFRLKHANGNWQWFRVRANDFNRISEKHGKNIAIFLEDFTERKHFEFALQKSQRRLIDINKMKDRFISVIAHDLRNPLTPITYYSKLLKEKGDQLQDETRNEYIHKIADQSAKMENLLNDLIAWSRNRNGFIKLSPEKVDIDELIESTLSFIEPMAERKSIAIDYKKANHQVHVDKDMILTVFRNLLINAIKFSPENEGKIEIWCDESDTNIKCSIKDNGKGIREEDISKIMDSSKNYTTVGTIDEKGCGIGLIICREFLETNEGKLIIESKPKEGSTFSLILPKIP